MLDCNTAMVMVMSGKNYVIQMESWAPCTPLPTTTDNIHVCFLLQYL